MIESHPDNAFEDLRLDCPFPGLVQYLESMDMSKMTKQVGARTNEGGGGTILTFPSGVCPEEGD